MKAVANINERIGPSLIGKDVTRQRELDHLIAIELDGTADKSQLGANATTCVSLALVRAGAAVTQLPLYKYLNLHSHILPVPLINLIGGGKLGSSDLEIQEFHIVPWGARSTMHALQIATEVREELAELVLSRYGKMALNVGDEGGFMPPMKTIAEPLEFLSKAVDAAGYQAEVGYSLDCAATHFYDPATQRYHLMGNHLSREELVDLYRELCASFPILSLEDPLHENDWEGFAQLTRDLDIQIVGDDLFVTNPDRVSKGIALGAGNALLWKVNQIGTLSEALDAAVLAQRNGFGVQVSERSGETEDPIIADLAVALNAGQIKTGAPVRGERTSKYNRLLQIEEELGSQACYAGQAFRQPIRRLGANPGCPAIGEPPFSED